MSKTKSNSRQHHVQLARSDWELAILVEAAEAIDVQRKWWKAGTDDIDNLKIEAIDLLHFMISNMLSSNDYSDDPGLLAVELNDEFTQAVNSQANEVVIRSLACTDAIKEIIRATLIGNHRLSAQWLFRLFAKLDMGYEDISAMYFAKNLLNEYRQARGYKDPNGSYCKVIDGQEDNVHFLTIVKEIGANAPDLKEQAFAAMDALVSRVV